MLNPQSIRKVHLVVSPGFYPNYLLTAICEQAGVTIESLSIAGGRDYNTESLKEAHQSLAGLRCLSREQVGVASSAYPDLSAVATHLIQRAGFPKRCIYACEGATYLSETLQCQQSIALVRRIRADKDNPLVLAFTDAIFRGEWLAEDITILNAHPGIVPYAMGIGAIEQIAVSEDIERFRKGAGCTIHIVTSKLDKGPIVATKGITNPFGYSSLAGLRAHNFLDMFSLMASCALNLRGGPDARRRATPSETDGYEVYLRKDRTNDLRSRAENAYQKMCLAVTGHF